MALYIPHSIFHLARLLYVRPETFGPRYVAVPQRRRMRESLRRAEEKRPLPVSSCCAGLAELHSARRSGGLDSTHMKKTTYGEVERKWWWPDLANSPNTRATVTNKTYTKPRPQSSMLGGGRGDSKRLHPYTYESKLGSNTLQ